MPSLGAPELLIILAIIVVLFGASRLGHIGGQMGRGIREFRSELREAMKHDDAASKSETVEGPSRTAGSRSH